MSEETPPFEPTAAREALRWLTCFLLVVAVHGAGALALLSAQERGEQMDAAPVVMMEFASVPIAEAPPRDVAPGREQVQSEASPLINAPKPEEIKEIDAVTEVKPQREQDTPPLEEAKPSQVTEAKPVESREVKPVAEDPLPIPELPQLQSAEVALETAQPPPPPPPVEEIEEKEVEEAKTAAPVAPAVAAVATTAPTSASARSATLVHWKSRLATHLQRYKRYPADARARREQGTAQVAFTVDRNGKIVAATLQRSSGSTALDRETLEMVRRAEPLPRPPADIAGMQFSFSVPVRFSIR